MTVLKWSLVVLALGVVVAFARPNRPEDLPHGLDSPVIAMDLATTQVQVQALAHADKTLPRRWYVFLGLDVFFAIAYGTLFYLLARQMRSAGGRLNRVAAIVGMAAAAAMAIADLGENAAIAAAISGSDAGAAAIRGVSLVKWGLLAVVSLVMALRFRQRAPIDSEPKVALVGASLFYAITAAIAVWALFDHTVLEQVAPSLSAAVLLHTCAMWMDRRLSG